MDRIIGYTPFSEYREEQSSVNIFDYFVTPSFFRQFCDKKPILIYGARGSGKTTIMKALSISEAKNVKEYIEKNDYLGIYYRIDLNVTTSFGGKFLEDEKWEKLFSHYLALALSYELIQQVIALKKEVEFEKEKELSEKFSFLISPTNKAKNFEQLRKFIYEELHKVRDFLNNCSIQEFPHICDYSEIIKDLPEAIVSNWKNKGKTVFYLIDEFEGLFDWQQQIVLSFAKYSNSKYTFKICMRPDGLKTLDTIGGEYISETDDVRSVDLTEKITENKKDFYDYAIQVCQKRMELFYQKNDIDFPIKIVIEELFEELSIDEELNLIFKEREESIEKEIEEFLNKYLHIEENIKEKLKQCFDENFLDFYIFRIIYFKRKENDENKANHVIMHDNVYETCVENYKNSILYYLCLNKSISKYYSGFNGMVNISGGTIRYLLEICNEIFEVALANGFSYNNPTKISVKIQTDAIRTISNKRVSQVSAIPELGLNIRTFIIALGRIFQIYHREDRISKIETNHFSLKADSGEKDANIQLFLKECVMRGVLIKRKNNKIKNINVIGRDEYIYILHPIYTPTFQISWRRKQKVEFKTNDLETLISNNTEKISTLIKKISKDTFDETSEDFQLKLPIM